jgi:hypothetical protein
MIRISDRVLDVGVQQSPEALHAALADTTFANHGYYGVMPRDIRLLLSEAAVATARQHRLTQTEPLALFVQMMVDMSPRFWCFEPFKTFLADPRRDEAARMAAIADDDMAPHWDAVLAHLEASEDWHLEHWDVSIDWPGKRVVI